MNTFKAWVLLCVLVGLLGSMAYADVFNMGGTRNPDGSWNGLASLETVPVGNPGNVADTRYFSPGFGSVGYTYNIGKYEVTAGQYCEFLNKVAATDTYGLYHTNMRSYCKIERSGSSGSYTYSVAADYANRPVNYVSYWDACRFANWLHNNQPAGAQDAGTTETGAYTVNGYHGADGATIQRNAGWKWAVTSEDEWYKAAYHKNDGVTGNYYSYPTSSDSIPGRDLNDTSGNNANYLADTGLYPIDWPYYTTVAGEFQNSHSPYGTFDQGGNVWERTEALYFGSYRRLRGGAYLAGDYCLGASYRYNEFILPTHEGGSTGFRVSQVPEPTPVAVLALGGAGLLVRQRGAGRFRRRAMMRLPLSM
ncbi:MAG: SUMF1/EgtB/PvdO family nonheme iron enzyme [Dehalococcoidia bacterium]|nr:SUMF1/EgtB/PvdO family nonheme iron enzyme [Dehalococcoidia bacterium]